MIASKYFSQEEFACHCGCGASEVSDLLIQELDKLRQHFGAPVYIMSGVRCAKHNKAVGGKPASQHLEGTAADIRVKGLAPKAVQEELFKLYPTSYGIGCYATFSHFDVRDKKARW